MPQDKPTDLPVAEATISNGVGYEDLIQTDGPFPALMSSAGNGDYLNKDRLKELKEQEDRILGAAVTEIHDEPQSS